MKLTPARHSDPVRTSAGSQAFSLIEVTLAVGLVSVAILAMGALMPVGLNTIKDAADNSIRAQIFGEVTSTLQATPYGKLADYVGEHSDLSRALYFDRTGRDATASSASFAVLLSAPAQSYPGAPSDISKSAQTVGVEIARVTPGAQRTISSEFSTVLVPKS
jgi:uncharacterized protein (TIGR02598 family)